jgi:hypothetical protein
MHSSVGVTNSQACCAKLPPRLSKRLLTPPRSLTHVANRSSRSLHICICTSAAGATAEADDSQRLSGDVVLQDGNLIHAAEVANVLKPILSGGGGGIFFFWQLGRSLYFPPKVYHSIAAYLCGICIPKQKQA